MASIINSIITDFIVKGAEQTVAATENVNKSQTRLASTSASAGRQFAAQSQGLGGIVAVYAGAAANIIAITSAFSALAKAARNEEIIKGTENLASQIGASGTNIIQSLKRITEGQLSIVDAATAANTALSAGFNTKQLEGFTEVATKASKVLGRDLSDSISRIVKGSAKLEAELLDELGIFTRIEPAVQKYAATLNRTVSSLTEFERRQAFANSVIEEGQRKFGAIDVGGKTAQQSIERLSASFADLTQKVVGFLANVAAPLADFFSKTGNLALVFGALTAIVFSKLKDSIISGLGAAFSFTTGKLDNFINKMQTAGPAAVEAFGKSSKEAMTALTGTGAIAGSDPKIARSEGAEIRRLLKDQDISIANAQKGSELTKKRMADLEKLGQTGTAQFKGLELASAAFNERLQGTGGGIQAASKAVEGLRGGLDTFKGFISGILGGLAKFVTAIAILQAAFSIFGIDLLGAIGEQFSKFGEAAAKNREEVEKLTSAILTANGINTQYASIIGATKEQQESATKAVAVYAEQLTRGSIADTAYKDSQAGLLETFGAQIRVMGVMRGVRASDIAQVFEATPAYNNLARSIEFLSAKGMAATTEEKLRLVGLKALKSEVDDVGMANFQLLSTTKATGASFEASKEAIKSLTTETAINSDVYKEFKSILTDVTGKIKGFTKGNELVGESYLATTAAVAGFNQQLSDGVGVEKLSQSLVNINARIKDFEVRYQQAFKGTGDLENSPFYKGLLKARDEASKIVTILGALEKANKDLQTTFASSLTAAEKLQVSGAINTKGIVAGTSLEEKTNQISYLQDTIKLAEGIGEKEKEGVRLMEQADKARKSGNIDLAKSLDTKVKELQLDSEKINKLKNAQTAQKALTGLIIESARETTKLLIEQDKATLTIQNQVRLEQAQQELAILENELTILKSRQDIESKLLDLTNQRVNAETGLANAVAASKQSEVENAIKLIGLQQELLSIESRRAEAGMGASNAASNRKGQQELLAAERKQNELNILGNLASEQQIRDADIAVARKKYELEIGRITREENLVRTKASYDLKAIDLREAQLRKDLELNDLKSIAAAKEGADQITLLNQRKEQDDLAYSNRVNQINAESAIADKNNQITLLRAEQSRSERNFQLDILDKQIALYALRAQIDNKLLEGLAANLEGEATLLALRQGENPDTKRIKELATQLAESTKNQFQTNVAGLQKNVADQKAASDSLYATEARNAELTRTLKKTLGDEELAFLAKKQNLTTQTYELEVQRIVENTTAKLNSLDADKKVIEGRIGGLNSERDIVRAQAAEKLTNLGIEKDKAIEILALAEKKYQLESQGILKFMQLIKGAIDTNLNKGVDSFFDAIKNGTLTLKTFREGVVGVFRDILFDIAKAATKEFLVKPITDAIGAGLGTIFGKEIAGKLTGSATAGLEKGAEASAKTLAGAATGQCGCISDALSKAGGVAEKAAGAAAPAVVQAAAPAVVQQAAANVPLPIPRPADLGTDIIAKRVTTIPIKPTDISLDTSKPLEVTPVTPSGNTISDFAKLDYVNPIVPDIGGKLSNRVLPFQSGGGTAEQPFGASGQVNLDRYGGQVTSDGITSSNFTSNGSNSFGFQAPAQNYAFGASGQQGSIFSSTPNVDPKVMEDFSKQVEATTPKVGDLSTSFGNLDTSTIKWGSSVDGASSQTDLLAGKTANLSTSTEQMIPSVDAFGTSTGMVSQSQQILGAATGVNTTATIGNTAATQAETNAEIQQAAAKTGGGTEGGGFFSKIFSSIGSFFGNASGGFVDRSGAIARFAAGGGVMMRDSVPALLEPGEFVMKKSAVDSIGRSSMERMNATGKSSGGATNIKVQVDNSGQPKEAQQGETQFDGETAIVKLILKDLNSNGPIRRSIRGNV